jgi:diguanylate cyclase (GGDEF)-like protein
VRERTEQLEEANRKLEELSFLDGLTEVANRRQFEQILDLEWRRAVRSQSPLSLIIADIDHFKKFNDAYGHQAGDRCLREVAHVLDSIVQRAGDQVARYGGEEFAAMLPETDVAGAAGIAERMRQAVEALQPEGNAVTVSFGVATTIATDQSKPEALVAAADAALYEAKHAGRNAVRSRTI